MPQVTTRPVASQSSRAPFKRPRASERGGSTDTPASSRHSTSSGAGIMRRKRRIDITNDEDRHTQQVPHAGPSNSKSTKEDGRKVKFAQEVFAREASKADSDEDNGFVGDDDDDEGEEEGWQKEEKGNPSILVLHTMLGGQIAAAFYEPEEKKVSVLEDTKDSSSWDLANLVMEQCNPDIIVTSTTAKDGLKDKVEAYCAENDSIEYDLQKTQDFSVTRAVDLMGDFNLADILMGPHQASQATFVPDTPSSRSSATTTHHENVDGDTCGDYAGMGKRRMTLVKLGCLVNVDAPIAMMTIGGLLAYLVAKEQAKSDEESQRPIEMLESMALDQHMLINRDALQSLAIIDDTQRTDNENLNQQKSQKLTLFDLFNTCSTAAGRKLFRLWFLRPLLDVLEIKKRHDAVAIFSAVDLRTRGNTRSGYEDNASLAEDVRKRIKGVKSVDDMMKKLRDRVGKFTEWKGITESVVAVIETQERLAAIYGAENLEVVQRFEAAVSQGLRQVMQVCTANIDWDMSQDEKRMCVRPGVDDELDELRKEQRTIDLVLSQLATKLSEEVDQAFFRELTCTYWDHIGFLVRVKTRGDGYPAPEQWDLIVRQDDAYLFKSPETRQLDEHFGDIGGVIRIKEAEIMAIMADKVLQYEAEFKQIVEVVAELDCLLALAKAATAFNLVRPTMAENPILNIHKGRNLLQEICVTAFVANDTKIEGGPDGERYHSMMIVTGANASGKSAYGKQVALIVFMAQIGSFVPAQEATLGIVDKIFTRIQTRESISKPASAFMIDLEQVSHALRGATERSLVILDEFGKGTEPADGAGLLAGVIEYLLNGPCPRTVVLTHFHELFTQQFISEDLQIQFCYMKAEFVEGSEGLAYLYKLKPGRCDSSFAAECALAHGMPKKIVDRGREVTHLLATHQLDKLWDTELTLKEIRELEKCETLAKRFLSWDIDPETTDVLETLQSIYESVMGIEEDDELMDAGDELQDQGRTEGPSRMVRHDTGARLDDHQEDEELAYNSSDQEDVDDDRTARWTVQLYSA